MRVQTTGSNIVHTVHNDPFSPMMIRRRAKTLNREGSIMLKQPPKKTFQDLEEQISCTHSTINRIVDQLEDVLENKLAVHEAELLKVFRFTVEKITEEVAQVVKHYHKVIEEVKLSNRLVVVENEMQFFRKEALTLFEQNKKFQDEVKRLKNSMEDMKDEIRLKDSTIFSLTKKICKYKSQQAKQNNLTLMTEPNLETTTTKRSNCLARSTTFTKNTRFKSIASEKHDFSTAQGFFQQSK